MAWTREQQLAIDTRDRTLLVSAAAGSGKTATLTERIIQSILDDKNPADIGRMLICTYTNAAVEELRQMITKKVSEAAKAEGAGARLEEQLLKIKDAKILTITSFCNGILRASASSIGLNPNYRIAEPSEAKILSSSLLESLINAANEGELSEVGSAEDFIALGESLASVKHSEELSEAIDFVFEKLKSTERGIDTLIPLIEEYDPDKFTAVEETRIGAYITEYSDFVFSEYLKAIKGALPEMSYSKQDAKNLIAAEADISFLERFLGAKTYMEKRDILAGFDRGKIAHPKPTDTDCEFARKIEYLHSELKDDTEQFQNKFYLYTEAEWLELYTNLYKMLGVFYRFIKRYYLDFMELKRKRGICEFADVERYAYEALYDKDGNTTPLAAELRSKFDYIYVDEYQDVNALQGKIFEAISNGKNRFMVGDIKQSIYGFRSARPEIFRRMKSEFPSLGDEGDYPAASIFMSNNFRCDETVVDFVNGVFDTLFGALGGSIGYVPEDRLGFSKIYEEGSSPTGAIPEIHLTEKPASSPETFEDADEVVDSVLLEERAAAETQALAITDKIKELLKSGTLASGKRIEPKDIAILFRSVKSDAALMTANKLKGLGIPVSVAEVGNLFLDESVLLALSMLYSIDNPRRDVYLTALMCSPLYDFTADELVRIRRSSESETLYEALCEYVSSDPSYGKGKSFLISLERYRRLSEGMATDTLLSLLYRESGLMALAEKNGGRENLILLLSYARKFERSDFKGLYSFISFINDVIENGEEFGAKDTSSEGNAVNIMTVHKSKGLEFPVTILANASSRGRTNTEKISFSEDFGISFRLKDDSGLALVENPACLAINHFIKRTEYEEELRVLYVALTRAREMLYVFGSCSINDTDKYLYKIDMQRSFPSEYFTGKAKTLFDMVMVGRNTGRLVIHERGEALGDCEAKDDALSSDTAASGEDEIAQIKSVNPCDMGEPSKTLSKSEYIRRFTFVNPLAHLEDLPEKISVSKLSPTVLDGSEPTEVDLEALFAKKEEDSEVSDDEQSDTPYLPSFMTGKTESWAAKIGIATHSVLQFADFERLEKEGVRAELERLAEMKYLTDEDRRLVRISEIDSFTRSELFSEMRRAKKLYRELRFNVKLPAALFTEDEKKKASLGDREVFVQGVIDCVIEGEDGSLHLVDYKTDRLTKEELSDRRLAEEKLLSAHRRQLYYYSLAIEKMFGRKPDAVGIYSLHLAKEVKVHD